MTKALSRNDEREIQSYVFKKIKNSDLSHKEDHVECVVKLCRKIAEHENCDMRILLSAAYFHDIISRERANKYSDFREQSAAEATSFLKELGFSVEDVDRVAQTIISSAYEAEEMGNSPGTPEARVLHDADLLESIGARGIARVFSFCGFSRCSNLGTVEWDLEKPPKLPMNLDGPDPSPIYHFFSKLLWVKTRMQTKLGKQLAKSRHKYVEEFLRRYDLECRTLA